MCGPGRQWTIYSAQGLILLVSSNTLENWVDDFEVVSRFAVVLGIVDRLHEWNELTTSTLISEHCTVAEGLANPLPPASILLGPTHGDSSLSITRAFRSSSVEKFQYTTTQYQYICWGAPCRG